MDEYNIPNFKFALREDLKNNKEFLPTRAEPNATGWDVRAAFEDRMTLVVEPFQYIKIPLGFRAFCPNGWWFELKPRSSSFTKKNIHALYGTVDETYEGMAIFAGQYIPEIPKITLGRQTVFNPGPEVVYENYITSPNAPNLEINFGDAIGQIIPVKRQEMNVIEATNEEIEEEFKNRAAQRGAGGFGSTGR